MPLIDVNSTVNSEFAGYSGGQDLITQMGVSLGSLGWQRNSDGSISLLGDVRYIVTGRSILHGGSNRMARQALEEGRADTAVMWSPERSTS